MLFRLKVKTSTFRIDRSAVVARIIPLPLWLLFVLGWREVLRHAPSGELTRALEVVAGVGALYGVVITFWIWLNMRQFRLKGPRRQTRSVEVDGTKDILGRAIELSPAVSLFDAHLIVDLRGGKKIYSSGQAERTADFVAVPAAGRFGVQA